MNKGNEQNVRKLSDPKVGIIHYNFFIIIIITAPKRQLNLHNN